MANTTFARKEREVLALIRIGKEPKEIASELEVSVRCIHNRIARMCAKAGVANRSELVAWTYQNPYAHHRGVTSKDGLHPAGCRCDNCVGAGME